MAASPRKPSASAASDAARLLELLRAFPWAQGLYARPEARDLVLGRPEWLGLKGELEDDDRLRLKGLGEGCYLIQARLHTGRYEDTGLAGELEEVVNHLAGPLRHYMGVWTKPPPKKRRRTSGSQY